MIQGQGPVASPPWATSGVPVSPGRCRGRRPAPHPGNPMGGREDAAPGPPHPRGDDDPRHQGPPRAQPGRAPGRARDRFALSGLLRAPHLRLLWGAPNGTKQDRRSPE